MEDGQRQSVVAYYLAVIAERYLTPVGG